MRVAVSGAYGWASRGVFVLCGLVLGYLAEQNLMWGVWGKPNAWYEALAPWGTPILLLAAVLPLRPTRPAAPVALIGLALLSCFFVPALINTVTRVLRPETHLSATGWAVLLLLCGLWLIAWWLALGRKGAP